MGRGGRAVTLYVREKLDCTAFTVSGDVVESLWVKIRRLENKGYVVACLLLITQQAVGTEELYRR